MLRATKIYASGYINTAKDTDLTLMLNLVIDQDQRLTDDLNKRFDDISEAMINYKTLSMQAA